jgi:aerobic-type carbon monoxide dehydrogenase small subunit (CoxS/CutS family)
LTTLRVNGRTHQLDLPPGTTLLSALRDYLHLTGAKFGCGEGVCGACTVLIDGRPRQACMVLAGGVMGEVTTIEGLAPGEQLHPVQQAFLDTSAYQCGYCTPGMILGAKALLDSNPSPTRRQIVDGLNGHLCRCNTYPRIVEAVELAARLRRKQ